MGEICDSDIYHSFRSYPEYMRSWISGLGEGESAFDNEDPLKCPHKIGKDGSIIQNVNKTGDKYKRQVWDKPALSVHTRNDQLASQNTIHPVDDRVFSIRELMRMMTIPNDFEWSETPYSELNALPQKKKREFLKKEETNIRQCIGEAVPTEIFKSIADNDFYVNMENIHLQSELKPIAKNEAKMKLLKARYKYSMVLIGLSILGYGKNHHDPENEQKSEIEEPEQTVRLVTRMLSPIILPMIAVMGDDLGEIIN